MSHYGRGSVRVNLRLPADTHAIIKRLAEYQEVSVAEMVQRTVEGIRPQLDKLIAAVEQSETIETVEQGVDVLGQLRAMSAHARVEADRLDAMIETWEQGVREAGHEQKTA
jgi:hypothetical protein